MGEFEWVNSCSPQNGVFSILPERESRTVIGFLREFECQMGGEGVPEERLLPTVSALNEQFQLGGTLQTFRWSRGVTC